MKKKTMSWASEESVVIYDGERALYTSPAFVNNVEREYETCLEKTPNLRYRISLRDSRKDSWSSGAWVDIRGKYLNTFFKSFMKESEEEKQSRFGKAFDIRPYTKQGMTDMLPSE